MESAFEWGIAAPREGNTVFGMGVDAQDFDNDGKPDLFYTALQDETFPLYRNTGSAFVELSAMSPLTRSMAGWGVAFADLDNDGWKDIAVARSGALSGRKEPLSWFANRAGKFTRQELDTAPKMYRGLVAADFDNDGCLDLVVTALNTEAKILRNSCVAGNWIKVYARGGRVSWWSMARVCDRGRVWIVVRGPTALWNRLSDGGGG